jgi:hypothetical protein
MLIFIEDHLVFDSMRTLAFLIGYSKLIGGWEALAQLRDKDYTVSPGNQSQLW